MKNEQKMFRNFSFLFYIFSLFASKFQGKKMKKGYFTKNSILIHQYFDFSSKDNFCLL